MEAIKSLAEYYEAKQKAVLLSDKPKGSAENTEFWSIVDQINTYKLNNDYLGVPSVQFWIDKQNDPK